MLKYKIKENILSKDIKYTNGKILMVKIPMVKYKIKENILSKDIKYTKYFWSWTTNKESIKWATNVPTSATVVNEFFAPIHNN